MLAELRRALTACLALALSVVSLTASVALADAPEAPSPSALEESSAEEVLVPEPPEPPEPDYLALADTPLFLPRNYFYWGTPVGPRGRREPLVFGLEYALHLPIFNNVRDRVLLGKAWSGAVTLSFEGALRMLSTDSSPVRMPSYRPSVSGQVFYAWHRPQPLLFGLRGSTYHYSNGQERCAFDETLSDQSPACLTVIETTQNLGASLNRTSGNFSTTGWLFELYGRVHELNHRGVAIGHLALGLGYAGIFDSWPGSLDRATRDLYGTGRLEANVEGKRRMGWAALAVRAAVLQYVRDDPRVPSTSGLTEIVLAPYWLAGLGLFARYFGGRDGYNAFFVDRLQQLTLGLAWDGERPLKFKRD